jgi:hypothetical protein
MIVAYTPRLASYRLLIVMFQIADGWWRFTSLVHIRFRLFISFAFTITQRLVKFCFVSWLLLAFVLEILQVLLLRFYREVEVFNHLLFVVS